jgi:hypothetical protein
MPCHPFLPILAPHRLMGADAFSLCHGFPNEFGIFLNYTRPAIR